MKSDVSMSLSLSACVSLSVSLALSVCLSVCSSLLSSISSSDNTRRLRFFEFDRSIVLSLLLSLVFPSLLALIAGVGVEERLCSTDTTECEADSCDACTDDSCMAFEVEPARAPSSVLLNTCVYM